MSFQLLSLRLANYQHPGYSRDHVIVPHGISVAVTGPAVFQFTSPSAPDRHREIAAIFASKGEEDSRLFSEKTELARLPDRDVGDLVYDRIAEFLANLNVPRGLGALGYKNEHSE